MSVTTQNHQHASLDMNKPDAKQQRLRGALTVFVTFMACDLPTVPLFWTF
jgi:hypothetical protein